MPAAPIEEPALDTHRPFTRADAVRAGIDPKVLRTSRFRRIFRGVYVAREVEVTPAVRTAAALALHPPSAFASHVDAARLLGLPVPHVADAHISVFRPQDRRSRPGITCHVAARGSGVVKYRGMRLSAPFRMFVELAGVLSLVDLVIVGDAMLRVFRIPESRLVNECEQSTDRHAVAARRAASYVRAEVDSPMETRLRMLIVLGGLPEPDVNHKIRDEHGHVLMRFDLCYPELRLIVEYDGRQHAEDPKQWNHDLERRETLDDEEWRILVVTSRGIFKEPARTLQRVRRALANRGCPDLPRQLSDGWRPFFPVH